MENRKSRWFATIIALPAIVLHAFVITMPALTAIYYSLTDWSGVNKPTFIGFANYAEIFLRDTGAHKAFLHNLQWLLMALTIPIIIGLLVALLVKRATRGQMFFRTFFFLPYVIASVVVSQIFKIFYNPFGGLNRFFESIGWTFLSNVD